MNQQTSETWQHSPSTIQVQSNPVKEVKKTTHFDGPTVSWEDLRGLSWAFTKESDYSDFKMEVYR